MSGKIMCSLMSPDSNYSRILLSIEEDFDSCLFFIWFEQNWQVCYYFGVAYLVAIFAGQEYMKCRPAFQLRGALCFWNLLLAAYSVIGAWRMVPTMFYAVQQYGFHASACSFVNEPHKRAVGVWLALFAISKVVELFDTAFIVLRKSKLIVLHWYHHVLTALTVWSTGTYLSPMHLYIMTANLVVHSIMYPYFALMVFNIRLPGAIKVAITSLQILQMVFCMFVACYMWFMHVTGVPCIITDTAIIIAIFTVMSYLTLFTNFFMRSYLRKKPNSSNKKLN